MQGRRKREIPEKTRRTATSSGTIPTCENQGVARLGIEPSSPWCDAFYPLSHRGPLSGQEGGATIEDSDISCVDEQFPLMFCRVYGTSRFAALLGGSSCCYRLPISLFTLGKHGRFRFGVVVLERRSSIAPSSWSSPPPLAVSFPYLNHDAGGCFWLVVIDGRNLPISAPFSWRWPDEKDAPSVSLAYMGRLARLPPRRSGFNPQPGHSGFSHVGIVPDDAVGRRVFSGISRFPALSFQRCSILTSIALIGSQDLDVKSRRNSFTSVYRVNVSTPRKPPPSPSKAVSATLPTCDIRRNIKTAAQWGLGSKRKLQSCEASETTTGPNHLLKMRADGGGAMCIWSSAGVQGLTETGDPRENPRTNDVARHDFHVCKSGVVPRGTEPGRTARTNPTFAWSDGVKTWKTGVRMTGPGNRTRVLLSANAVAHHCATSFCERDCNSLILHLWWSAHQGEPGSIPGRSPPGFSRGFFSRGSPVSPALSLRRRSILTIITLIESQDLDVKSSPNLFNFTSLPVKGERYVCSKNFRDFPSSLAVGAMAITSARREFRCSRRAVCRRGRGEAVSACDRRRCAASWGSLPDVLSSGARGLGGEMFRPDGGARRQYVGRRWRCREHSAAAARTCRQVTRRDGGSVVVVVEYQPRTRPQ
ncbi:hypothetical protein PR048_000722 [Dryococelus australis]|uniref:Uncharacterized protein n=1 Tax=Dryococelus australis TaxID=614101 RepID=A0ABQ9IGU3_9NEOP|nr:hypothetical protein PR048_000722 [Dryococelus australis]